MTVMNFPANPTVGQTYDFGQYRYRWDGEKWSTIGSGFNQGAILTTQMREALRRSYAEAGYNLVVGSFEAGGTLVNANDVLLQERTGKAFSGPAGVVVAGTNPASGGFVDRSNRIVFRFNSVSDMSQSVWLQVGALVETDAYNSGSGIGAAKYRITSDVTNQNNSTKIPIGTGLSAQLLWDGTKFDAAWSGATLDGVTDDWQKLHDALKVLGKFGITSVKNTNPDLEFVIPSQFKLSKSLWCGYNNIVIKMRGKCLVDSSTFTGNSVIDFDYSLLQAPADVQALITAAGIVRDGGWHNWNARHRIDIENTKVGYDWPNVNAVSRVVFNFVSNPANGAVVFLNGYKITFGTDVAIGASNTATRDNFITYVNANFKQQAFAVNTTAELYASNPWLSFSSTAAITVIKWTQGLAAVRVSNMWNGVIEFLSCTNFDIQLWENPCNKSLGGESYSEFGMENNRYDYGKSQNCQIVHLASPVVQDITNISNMPYCIDTVIQGGSVRVTGDIPSVVTKPHYVHVFACKYIRVRGANPVEAETAGSVTAEHALCQVLGDNENYDYDIRYQAERYKSVGRICDIGKTGNGPSSIYIRTSFGDFNGVPTFRDDSKGKLNFSDVAYYGAGRLAGIEEKFVIPVFVAGKIGKLRDTTITGNVTLTGMKWYTRPDNTESANISSAYWDTAKLDAKCDGYKGPGVTVVNETSGVCRFRVDHQGGVNTRAIIRFLDSEGTPLTNSSNLVSASGATYDSNYRGFVSVVAGKSISFCTMAAGIKAQVFIANVNDLANSATAKALRIMQYHNEEMLHKD